MRKEVAIGLGLAAIGIIVLVARAKAAPPPGGYVCPYCDAEPFDTLEELEEHVRKIHPGSRLPIDIDWV